MSKCLTDIHQIDTGDNILVSSNSWLAEEIQWFQGSIWNHAGKFIWLFERLYVCEAAENGICLTPFEDYMNSNKGLMIQKPRNPYTDIEKKRLSEWMLPRCGHVKYEYKNLLIEQPIKYIAKKLTGKELWIGSLSEHKADKRYICGEWVMRCDNVVKGWYSRKWMPGAPVDLFHSGWYENYLWKRL